MPGNKVFNANPMIIIFILAAAIFSCLPIADPSAGIRGRLANSGFENRSMKSAFFFCGNWRNGDQFYEYNPADNRELYTVHPSDPRHLGWSESAAKRNFAVDEMLALGVNVVNMSYWGPRGTDNWVFSAPMQTSTYAHDELFDAALGKNILIAPYVESYASTLNHPGFSFMDCFPGTQLNPAPEFITLINDLVDRYLVNPSNPAWPSKWARMYDKDGQERYVISVIHVASNQPGVTDQTFAEGFDWVAEKIYQAKGVRVGFTLDVLPSGTGAAGSFKASAVATGLYLAGCSSVLAIQCFIPEIHTGFDEEDELISWKQDFSSQWINSGVPFIQDISPGYDGHIVFPSSVVYGNNDHWRDAQTLMLHDLASTGMTFNCWNGFTEGFAAMRTTQYGTANRDWAAGLFANGFN